MPSSIGSEIETMQQRSDRPRKRAWPYVLVAIGGLVMAVVFLYFGALLTFYSLLGQSSSEANSTIGIFVVLIVLSLATSLFGLIKAVRIRIRR